MMDGTARIQVAVHHGLPLVRAGLAAVFTGQPDLVLQQDWQPREGAMGLAAGTRVLVLDFATGLRMADELRQGAGPRGCHVMIVTAEAGEWDIRQAVARGVLGFHLLDSPLERIVAGVRQLARGSRSFDDAVAARMADCLLQPLLTERERDVLGLIAGGARNKDIARRLGIALGTVKAHVRALLDKLGVQSRVQAVIVARQRGLVGLAPGSRAPAQQAQPPALAPMRP